MLRVRLYIVIVWCCLFVCTTNVSATTMFATVNGDDKNDGLSWATGKRTVYGALSSGHARRVVLGAGVFIAAKPIKFGDNVPWVPSLSITGQVIHARTSTMTMTMHLHTAH